MTGGHQDEDLATFIDTIAFNWLVTGTDAHARNYSLLHTRSSTRLAPLYDLNSFLPYATSRPFSLAMRIGCTERDPANICARHWDELARDCGVDSAATLVRVDTLAENLLAAIDDVVTDASVRRWGSPLPARLQESLVSHVRACQRRLWRRRSGSVPSAGQGDRSASPASVRCSSSESIVRSNAASRSTP